MYFIIYNAVEYFQFFFSRDGERIEKILKTKKCVQLLYIYILTTILRVQNRSVRRKSAGHCPCTPTILITILIQNISILNFSKILFYDFMIIYGELRKLKLIYYKLIIKIYLTKNLTGFDRNSTCKKTTV